VFAKRAQDPRIIPTFVSELDGFRVFLEGIEHVRNMIPIALQAHRRTFFIFAREFE
jgi:hypothetical protein